MAEMAWLVQPTTSTQTPVLVICGLGGMGKTALMLHAAHQVVQAFPDGQLYGDLRATAGPPARTEELLAEFLRGFGVARVPETRSERLALYRTLTADRRVLVLLDDAADEEQIRDLVPANPACAVLVTTRRRRLPDLDGAVHHVPSLAALMPATAIELFRRVVARSGVELPADDPAIERVVDLCAGLPLAVRIAAAQRSRDHPRSTTELADRLARVGLRAFTYRERSVALTIGSSFDQLDSDAQHLFLALAVARLPEFGSWTAAALLDDPSADPADALSRLAAYSLVESAGSRPRYRFHDLTRDYAYELAAARYSEPERRLMSQRAYSALLTLTRRAHRTLVGGDFEVVHGDILDSPLPGEVLTEVDASPMNWFELERPNIGAAVARCADLGMADLAWDLAFSAHELYTRGGYFDDWYDTHTAALRACVAGENSRGEAVMLVGLGQPALVASRRSGGLPIPANLERAIELLTGTGDRHGRAIAERTLANALRRGGQLGRPLELFQRALVGYEASDDRVGRWQTLRYIAHTYLDRREHDEALSLLQTALTAAAELGDRAVAQTRYWMGQAHLAAGELDAARADFTAVLDAFPEPVGSGHAYAAHGLGEVSLRLGDLDDAAARLDLAARLAREAEDGTLEGRVFLSIAGLRMRRTDPDAEVAALWHAAECFAAADAVYLQAQALAELSLAEARRGDAEAAALASNRVRNLYAAMDIPLGDRIHEGPALADRHH